MKLRTLLVFFLTAATAFSPQARGTTEEDDSLGARIKHLFGGHSPTPTPTPPKKSTHKKSTPAAEHSPTPASSPESSFETAASPSPAETSSLPSSETTPPEATGLESPSPSPASTTPPPKKSHNPKAQYFEPVRPISPPPNAHSHPVKSPAARREPTSPPEENAAPSETPNPVASTSTKKKGSQISTIATPEIKDYDNYSVDIRQIVDLALDLTTQNLRYKYNSAVPANGGMDCSGFIYYVLSKSGIKDVPRDARDQYVWVRKAGNFQAVLSQRDDTFELAALKPGDLLFWANIYGVNRDPDVTHTMIYLGREKGTNQRIMVGSSDGWSYKGQPRFGVSVFDFKVGRSKPAKSEEPGPTFIGYARIPGLPAD